MRRIFFISFVGLLFTTQLVSVSGQITGSYSGPVTITSVGLPRDFPITISTAGVVAHVSVTIKIDHPRPTDLIIQLLHTAAQVNLHEEGQPGIPVGFAGINASFDSQSLPGFQNFTGLEAEGVWTLHISDEKEGQEGRLLSWLIEIEPAQLATLEIGDPDHFLQVRVDGYGSFGDQRNESASGAIFQLSAEFSAQSTVVHSALLFHDNPPFYDFTDRKGFFLSSLDMFPGEKLSSVGLIRQSDGSVRSRFAIRYFTVDLTQRLIAGATDEFVLIQEYDFSTRLGFPSLRLSRYINTELSNPPNDPIGKINYAVVQETAGMEPIKLFIFNDIKSATTERSMYVGIGFETADINYSRFIIDEWKKATSSFSFPEIMYQEGWDFYRAVHSPPDPRDIIVRDSVTDPGMGYDVAFGLGSQLLINPDRHARYVAITRWGYSSPAEILSATQASEIITNTPTPTPSPTPTDTPTATPTRTPAPPQFLKSIPDIRLLQNRNTVVLDLNNFVYDPDTPKESLMWEILSNSEDLKSHFLIDSHNQLIGRQFEKVGDLGSITLQISDGQYSIQQTVRVKVSSFLTRSFYQLPPIVLTSGEVYHSPYRLDDLVIYRLGDKKINWQAAQPFPIGVREVQILEDTSFSITPDENLKNYPVQLIFLAKRGEFVPTPTLKPSPTWTVTPIPTDTYAITPSPTYTSTPTSTWTPSPTFSFTPTSTLTPIPEATLTATFTPIPIPTSTYTQTLTPIPAATNTPTFTWTPTPTDTPSFTPAATITYTPTQTYTLTPTISPSWTPTITATYTNSPTPTPTPFGGIESTPTPTVPPTPACTDDFVFTRLPSVSTMIGPIDYSFFKNPENVPNLIIGHYDDNVLTLFKNRKGQFVFDKSLSTDFGTANIGLVDVNGDSMPDVMVLNTLTKELSVFLTNNAGNYVLGPKLNLIGENLLDIYDVYRGMRYQALAVGIVDSQGSAVAVVRGKNSLVVISLSPTGLVIQDRIPIDGITRFLKGVDLNGDQNMDLVLGYQSSQAHEQVLILNSREGQFYAVQNIRTDVDFVGNSPLDAAFYDLDGDGILDMGVSLFSGAIRLFAGRGNGTFNTTPLAEPKPFPPGIVEALEFADFDQDGRVDVAALHRSQSGIQLIIGCGVNSLQFTDTKAISVKTQASTAEEYVMKITDINGDGDPDILFTQSLDDTLDIFENRRIP